MAEEFVASIETSWPARLCSFEHAKQIGVALEVAPLEKRFRMLAKKRTPISHLRRHAIKIISDSGQIAAPIDGMTLWQYFKPEENTLINKGALAAKERALHAHRNEKRRRPAAAPVEPAPPREIRRPPPVNIPPPGSATTPGPPSNASTATTTATLDELMACAPPSATLPGLLRGKAAGMAKGQGRGGAIQRALKIAVRQLVVEDHVPIRDVPKVIVDVQTALTQRVPEERELITHSHISEWIVQLGAEDLHTHWAEFWSVREEFGDLVVLHVGHDGSRRPDRKLGRHGELMQFLASYFNPRPSVNRAVEFLISFRFTVGGSAPHTARALVVNLANAGFYKVSASADRTTAFRATPLVKGVLFDLGTDNTGSALNVSDEVQMITGEPCGVWPCPTHINALDGKTPIVALTGDVAKVTDDKAKQFDLPNALNIGTKWWYICDKHLEVITHWWPQLTAPNGGKAQAAVVKAQPLMGKWESVGAAHSIIYANTIAIRKFVTGMEYHATGMTGLGSLKQDCKLLSEWMHDEEIWFHFLVCHDWFTLVIDPTFQELRKRSKIHPESGHHLGRQMVPRLALNAICRAYDLPTGADTAAAIDAKAAQYIPNARRHTLLAADRAFVASEGWQRFEILPEDGRSYLLAWASSFTPKLRVNAEKHWRGFLRSWKVAGLVTDPELGVFVARHLTKLVTKDAVLGGEPTALGSNLLGPNLKLQVAEINRLMAADGAEIALALVKEGLFNSEARRADWVKLCALPPARSLIDWTRATLPELAPWFESRFFGGHRCNYPLEQGFSIYGQHVEAEQGADLKEAIVAASKSLQEERQARMSADFRVPKVSTKAKERYEEEKEARAAEGDSEELKRDSENRTQLLARATSLLERMGTEDMEEAGDAATVAGMTAAAFGRERKTSWKLLYLREAKALEGEMKEKREKGRAKLTADPFGRGRKQRAARNSAAYRAAAAAAEKAATEADEALARAQEQAERTGDASDEDVVSPGPSPTASPRKKKRRKGRGRGQ